MTETSTDTTTTSTPAYAVAYLREVDFGAAITEYLQRIDETLEPFGGRFLVHGGNPEFIEGDWGADDTAALVVIEFPDELAVRAWYASPGYQAILPLRTEHTRSLAAILDGVPAGYRAADAVAGLPTG